MKWHPFSEVVTDVTAKFTKVKASDYRAQGRYKIIDQGKKPIAGYTDDSSLVNEKLLPVVIFGDHTRVLKYVDEPIALGADGAKALRVNPGLANARYVYYYLRSIQIKEAGYSRHFKFLKEIAIPIPLKDGAPNFDAQIRIAHLLAKVEELIAQRKQHLQYLDDLLKSVFLEMFGDPVRNERGWETQPFSKIGKFTSGGTPSKSRGDFWAGEFPWVSPKDMKVPKIFDSEDHVSAKVFDETSLKRITPGHLLIVVRGMILAHSFPAAINMVDVAINQDMKAIKVNSDLRTAYVFHCLNALKRQILKLITTAGHGTKKFDSDVMAKLLIPVPTPEIQDRFLLIADKIEGIKSGYLQSLTDLEALYGVLSQQAFKGELDLSRVPLPKPPTQHITHVSIGDQAVVPEPVVQAAPAIDLPASDKLPAALESAEARKALIAEWLEAYRQQLGDAPFSVQDFMAAASDRLTEWLQAVVEDEAVADEQKNRLAESYSSNDVGLDVNDYEHIKKWIFEALVANRLTQSRSVTGYDEQSGEPIFGNLIELKASQT
ncbi:restriction endonuclease subunit S [Pseudomonas japonica]|uniref:restriction endonuclease subunit S n=1 Tax=Pseudomonas japonica TaxID=256466 RepID=UPI00381119DC